MTPPTRGLSALIVVLAVLVSGCYSVDQGRQDDYSATLVVWNSVEDEYHKLLFHTVSYEGTTISGFSLNTLQMETFQVSDENRAQFDRMKQDRGVTSREVKCIRCHLRVEGKP